MADALSFAELVERIRNGDQQAAEELVRRYEPAIRRAVRFRLTDPRLGTAVDSMDICQSVLASFFVRAASGQYELNRPEDLHSLLMAMARKKLAMQARRQRAQRRDNRRNAVLADAADLPAAASTPSQQVAARELLAEVHKRLSPEERQLVEWRQQGMEWTAIAAQLGTSAEAVRKRLSRALDVIAADLGIDESADHE
jgi:RNA polymerase sigma-70 factor (ECF subfamily)